MKIREITLMRLFPRNDELHPHPFFELAYVLQGRAIHQIGLEQMPLRAGQFFIIDTGTSHRYTATDHFEIINCLFMPRDIDRALIDCSSLASMLSNQVMRFGVPINMTTADRIFDDNDGSVGRIMRHMVNEYNEKRTGYRELLRCQLTQVLVYAVRAAERSEAILHPAIVGVVEYLRTHYAEPFSLSDLSNAVGYAPSYISGLFSHEVGMTVSTYLRRFRIEQAGRLLTQSNLSIDEIAAAVGYQDRKHFNLIFRQIKGVSPGGWRKKEKS